MKPLGVLRSLEDSGRAGGSVGRWTPHRAAPRDWSTKRSLVTAGVALATALFVPTLVGSFEPRLESVAAADAPPKPSGTAVDDLEKELEKLFAKKAAGLSDRRKREILALIDRLNKEEPSVRQRTREDLLAYGTDPTPFLLERARSDSHDEARAALVALAMIEDLESIPFLEETLRERKAYFVTLFAALALGKLGHGPSAPILMDVVLDAEHRDAFDRAASAVALARIGAVAEEQERAEPFDVAPLRKLLESENDTKVIASVLMVLGKHADRESFSIVERFAKAPEDRQRRAAVLALGDLGDPRATPLLAERVRNDEDETTVRFAAGSLSAFPSAEVGELLLELIERGDLDRTTQAVVLRSLGAQPPSEAIESVLLRFVQGKHVRGTKVDPIVRGAALAALRAYDSKEVLQTLSTLLRTVEDSSVRSAVIMLLAQKGYDTKLFRAMLRESLSSEDRSIAETSALALASIDGKAAEKALDRVPKESRAYPFVRNVLAGFDRPDSEAYFDGWVDKWVDWLGGSSEALRRNLASDALFGIFELDRRITKGSKTGEGRPRLAKVLSTAQQDLRLWLEFEPYFDRGE